MPQNPTLRNFIAGVDNIVFDQRPFDLSPTDLKDICRFFRLGNLIDYQKERNVVISHSNFFVDVHTQKGRYALKFYPLNAQKLILHELTVNRLLKEQRFPTPGMYANDQGIPFFPCQERLAACYEFVDGTPAWQHIKDRNIIGKIVENISWLKHILLSDHQLRSTHRESLLTTTLRMLHALPLLKISSQGSEIIHLSMRKAVKAVKDRPQSFQRQWLHNNTTLTNFLVKDKTLYTLDLSHIREDYALSDLSTLIMSCLFLKVPQATINTLTRMYFIRHKLTKTALVPLNILLTVHLTQEFIKNAQRIGSLETSHPVAQGSKIYLFQLKARTKLVLSALKKINGSSFFKL